MPQPSSLTRISFLPPSSRATSMTLAPASMEFSTSSFTTEDGRSTTSPAAIWSATALERMVINGILSPKLPVLSPRRRGNVSLLAISLNVLFAVLGGVEDRFRLLWRHSRHRSRGRSLIRSLSRGRSRLCILATTAAATTATTATAAALFFSQRQLVVPAGVGVGNRDLEDLLVAVEGAVEWCFGRIFRGQTLLQVIEPEVEPRMVAHFFVPRIHRPGKWRNSLDQ